MMVYIRVVPGFRIAVEELRHPELRFRPVILGGLPHQRGTVREANALAQRCGVHAGMALSQAHQQCPDGVFLVPDPSQYETVWEAMCEVLQTYTPLVEPLEMGQAVCDLSGCEQQWGDGWSAARAIARQIRAATGIAPWLGVASNRLVAQLASMTVGADGISVLARGQERAFLADLPITLLPEVDPRLALTFHVLGLRTIGQFAALPALSVKQRFGVVGERLYRYAHGIDPRPVVPPPAKPSVVAHQGCEDGSLEAAVAAINRLSQTCAAELQRRHLAGRLLELTLLWECPLTPGLSLLEGVGRLANREVGQSLLLSLERGSEGEGTFPIPYRIHSMLPQPDSGFRARKLEPAKSAPELPDSSPLTPPGGRGRPPLQFTTRRSVVVRTPIDTAPSLFEQAQRLLLRIWPVETLQTMRLQAIELAVSEFEPPAQLSFAEFNRLDQTGMLGGMRADRLQALTWQEQVLAARYGEAPFRHVAQVDPDNVLAERRFRWQPGLGRGRPSAAGTLRGGKHDQAVLRADYRRARR